jgi:hypothetical protein
LSQQWDTFCLQSYFVTAVFVILKKATNYRNNLNPLTPNGHYIDRTAPITSRRCILNIYSTNIPTEYFKHAA